MMGRSVFPYNMISKKLILGLKYGARTDLVPLLGNLMILQGKECIEHADILVPVPLYWKRLMQREYNQAGLLAKYIATKTGKKFVPNALKRIKQIHNQKGLNREERLKNVRQSFAVDKKKTFEGKRVLLIDDVWTTGATIETCCKILLKNGATEITVLTCARRLPLLGDM